MSNGVVFIYHRVVELEHDPQRLAVHPRRFEDQIRYLKKRFTIISLQELVEGISSGQSLENCAVITFDDGYADNLYFAKPILEKYHVPAAVFVTVGMIGSKREPWWDELELIFLVERIPFNTLQVHINDREHTWDIPSKEAARKVYRELHPLLKYLPHKKREKILDDLFSRAKLDRDAGRETHRILNEEEIRELASGDLVEIGSHSLTHTVLKGESEERKRLEIKESKTILEKCINRKVYSFSYPFGLKRDIDEDTIRIVKNSGYVCGIANIQANIDKKTSRYLIPRRLVRDWNPDEFRQKIEDFLNVSSGVPESKNPRMYADTLKDKITIYLNHIKTCEKKYSPADSKKKIRNILFINYLDQKGGAAKVCYRIFENLDKKKFHMDFLVGRKRTSDKNIHEIEKINTTDQQFLHSFQEQEGWLDIFFYSSFFIKHTQQFHTSDIIHLHNLHKNYFSILALPEITCLKPTVWTLHDMQAFTGHCNHSYDCHLWESGCGHCPDLDIEPGVKKDNTDLLWKLKKIVYEYSQLSIVCPSNWLKSKLEKSILKDKKISLIYNGVDETVFRNINKRKARRLLNLPHDKTILLFVVAFKGLRHHLKGGNFIHNVLERLAKEKILLLSIGKSDFDSENLKTLPYIEDEEKLALYYSAADMLLYPSLADNCPLVVLESLSCGTPVISFHTGGIPELVTHKETGYLAEYKNLSDLVKGVEFYLTNPSLLKRASKNARRSVLKKFTLEKMIKKYLDLYKSMYRDFFTGNHTVDKTYRIKVSELLGDYYNRSLKENKRP